MGLSGIWWSGWCNKSGGEKWDISDFEKREMSPYLYGHLHECGGHSRVAQTQTGGVVQGTDVASLSIIRALRENANQKTKNGNGVDERGKVAKMRKIGNGQFAG